MTHPGQTDERGWWSRNAPWALPVGCLVGCLGLVLAAVVLTGGIAAIAFLGIRWTDVYEEAVKTAVSDPDVIAALGEPVKTGSLASGSVRVSGASGEADLSIPLEGSRAKGTLYVIAHKRAGRWEFERLEVEVEGGSERIDLLDPNRGRLVESVPEGRAARGLPASERGSRDGRRLAGEDPESRWVSLGMACIELPPGYRVVWERGRVDAFAGFLEAPERNWRMIWMIGMWASLLEPAEHRRVDWTKAETVNDARVTIGLLHEPDRSLVVLSSGLLELALPADIPNAENLLRAVFGRVRTDVRHLDCEPPEKSEAYRDF